MKNLSLILIALVGLVACQPVNPSEAQTINPPTPKSLLIADGDTAQAGKLQLLAAIDNAYYYIDDTRENMYLYTELKADFFEQDEEVRTPLNLSIVIDRSGSMQGEKLEYAKEAAEFVVNQLSPNDIVSIVVYDDYVKVVSDPQNVEDKSKIVSKIKSIQDGGSTFLSGGMEEGFKQVKSKFDTEYLNRVLLMTDGLANVGLTTNEDIIALASSWNERENISLSTFGIGLDYNEDLMVDLAEYAGGNYYFIAEPGQIPGIFEKELSGLLSAVAKDVNMSIYYPSVLLNLIDVYGYRYTSEKGKISIKFGDMYSEELKAVVVKFSMDELNDESIQLITEVNFKDLTSDNNDVLAMQITSEINPSNDLSLVQESENSLAMQQAVLFESNYAMEMAAKAIDNGDYDGARDILELNSEYIEEKGNTYGWSDELIRQNEANTKYSGEVEYYEDLSTQEQEYIQKSNKMESYEIRKKK